jgi:serine phosphatase RsbU (regulator of sigma subunit)
MVQQAFVPNQPLKVPGYGFFHFYNPMLQVGGDYFDYVHLQDGRIAIVVADVTGHGIAAAMFMAKVSSETRFALATIADPAQAISVLNERLSQLMVERFVTMVVTILDPETGEVVVVNAGHMAPIVRTRTGELVEPSKEESGLALGIIDAEVYQAAKFTLEPGELFALYTDGINESVDEKGNQFTIERMMSLIASSEPVVHNVGQTIINQVTAHVGKAAPFDDMCLVVVGRSKASPRTI